MRENKVLNSNLSKQKIKRGPCGIACMMMTNLQGKRKKNRKVVRISQKMKNQNPILRKKIRVQRKKKNNIRKMSKKMKQVQQLSRNNFLN